MLQWGERIVNCCLKLLTFWSCYHSLALPTLTQVLIHKSPCAIASLIRVSWYLRTIKCFPLPPRPCPVISSVILTSEYSNSLYPHVLILPIGSFPLALTLQASKYFLIPNVSSLKDLPKWHQSNPKNYIWLGDLPYLRPVNIFPLFI